MMITVVAEVVVMMMIMVVAEVVVHDDDGSGGGGDNRDLKIRGREQLGRLPEVNLPTRACARELLSRMFAVVVSSRTAF